jgi:hypothetical protein
MFKFAYWVLTGLVAVVLMVGCASSIQRTIQLDNTLTAYEHAIRWSDFETAAAFADPRVVEIPNLEMLKNVKVTSYEVKNGFMTEDKLTLRQIVLIEYYDMNHMTQRAVVDNQQWVYNEENKQWVLQSNLPNF